MTPHNNSMWTHEGHFNAIKNGVCKINGSTIKSLHPKGNEHNKKRAFQLLKSGSMQHMSLQHITCNSRLNPDEIILLFKINVSPSMKTKTKKCERTHGQR